MSRKSIAIVFEYPVLVSLSQDPVGGNVLIEHINPAHARLVISNALGLVQMQNHVLSIDFRVLTNHHAVVSAVHCGQHRHRTAVCPLYVQDVATTFLTHGASRCVFFKPFYVLRHG